MDLRQFTMHIRHLQETAENTTATELAECRAEVEELRKCTAARKRLLTVLERRCDADRADVRSLQGELTAALQRQRHKLEYEGLAQKIIVYPSREELDAYVVDCQRRHSQHAGRSSSSRIEQRLFAKRWRPMTR